ncbi:DUF4149 domain-containing protein [Caenimonas koreensis]|uniref:DUF4149 domain-containing protein n=1 Tax=Caenimonas koreensis DSM 17982 TaxID=1121255 RepID=A0A844B0C1_9BURK|nr:DUF4149 domain-containing protein [Caenimonas koreensis]MRD48148.1 DUF4149 domain-containing protein [Caenimonas koreensis DSM 17982]
MSGGWKARAGVLACALWWGSLTTIGFIVVPLLFANLPTPADAGRMAARLFTAQTWVSIGCGIVVMLSARATEEVASMDWKHGVLMYLFAGVLLAVLAEFAVAPHIIARQDLRFWHSVGSVMYFLQWLCAGTVLWKVTSAPGVCQVPEAN